MDLSISQLFTVVETVVMAKAETIEAILGPIGSILGVERERTRAAPGKPNRKKKQTREEKDAAQLRQLQRMGFIIKDE